MRRYQQFHLASDVFAAGFVALEILAKDELTVSDPEYVDWTVNQRPLIEWSNVRLEVEGTRALLEKMTRDDSNRRWTATRVLEAIEFIVHTELHPTTSR